MCRRGHGALSRASAAPAARGRRLAQTPRQLLEARQIVHRQKVIDVAERRHHASRERLVVGRPEEWVEPHDWVTKEYPKKMRDVDLQIYPISALFLQKGPVRVLLDPVAYDVPGAEGVVDLYLMPTYDDMASLFFEKGKWTIHYAFPPNAVETHSLIEVEALPISEKTINQVLDSIATHAEPSF